MAADSRACPNCGTLVPSDALVCSSCQTPLAPASDEPTDVPTSDAASTGPPTEGASVAAPTAVRRAASAGGSPFGSELARRLHRLGQWAEGAAPLGVTIPRLPRWAEEAARAAPDPAPWAEVVRGIERIAQQRITAALEDWERSTRTRLTRLEAYSVDSRLERDQIEDTLHSARTGDIPQALATLQQVERVVALKERHLDQARDELERVIALLKDMQALGVDPPQDPTEVAEDLESELRAGKLASLKQQIRALRLQAVNRLKAGLPRFIGEYGEHLLAEREHGTATEVEATELARGAREFFHGHPEEGLRRLRSLQERHGPPPGKGPRSLPSDPA